MRKLSTIRLGLMITFFLLSAPVYADREITIGYQGIIEAEGELLDDADGFFKFAVCDRDCLTTYWSNDDTSEDGSEPVGYVSVPIFNGIFNILLGDTSISGMDGIPTSVFEEAGDTTLYLRVWFDDGVNGFELLVPDQRLPVVPWSVRTMITGDLIGVGSVSGTGNLNFVTTATGNESGVVFNTASVVDGAGVLIQVGDLGSEGRAIKIEDSSRTLFSVNENGSAASRDIVLEALTGISDVNRFETGRIFYDGTANTFKACTNATCSEIALAVPSGTPDITSVTAGDGLIGGGASGAVTLSIDTSVVVTKTGDHTMAGALTASALSATTVTATTVNTAALNATGAVTAASLSLSGTATVYGVVLPPTGTGAGNTAELRFNELSANGPHYVGLKAPDDILLNRIWTLPSFDGSSGQVLHTNGSGTLSWADDDNAGGDITSVTAGLGLSGGATSGNASLNIGAGTGIQLDADSIQLEYDYALADDPAFLSGQAGFDRNDAQGGIIFEGDLINAFELLLTVAEPTADQTLTLPDATGTIALTTSNVATATALAADPADCGGNTFANAINASGTLGCSAVPNGAVDDDLTISGGTVDNSVIGGVTPAAGSFTTLTASSSITSSAGGTIGWSVVSAADTACSTTCTNACVFGQDTGTMGIVDCANATADVCVCAGAN